jgi:stage II sporulation protein R
MTRENKCIAAKLLIPLAALILAALLSALPIHGEQAIYDGVVRLHVLANSDSDADQAVKLKVRDAVLDTASTLLEGCKTEAEAEAVTRANLDTLAAAAERVLKENGFEYVARVTLGREFYPCREYEGFYLPEGTYMSLRVLLGKAEGQNWWCVLFPPLCTANAEEYTEKLKEVGFTPYQIKLLTESDTPRYKLKFRIVELLREWFGFDAFKSK